MPYANIKIYIMDDKITPEGLLVALKDYGFDAVFGTKYDFEVTIESEGE